MPIETSVIDIDAFSANRRFRSFSIQWSYSLFAPTPGSWWNDTSKELLVGGGRLFLLQPLPRDALT